MLSIFFGATLIFLNYSGESTVRKIEEINVKFCCSSFSPLGKIIRRIFLSGILCSFICSPAFAQTTPGAYILDSDMRRALSEFRDPFTGFIDCESMEEVRDQVSELASLMYEALINLFSLPNDVEGPERDLARAQAQLAEQRYWTIVGRYNAYSINDAYSFAVSNELCQN